ncbi:MAG: hypothetical protein ACTHK6_02300 [Solirubrobacterales bacterium]
MSMPTIPKTIFNSSIKLARTPFDVALGVLGGAESPARHLLDRAEAGARSATGVLFADEELKEQGRTALLATKERERAVRLRETAEVREREAEERQAEVGEAAREAEAEARRQAEQERRKAEKRRREREARAAKAEAKKKEKAAKAAAMSGPANSVRALVGPRPNSSL